MKIWFWWIFFYFEVMKIKPAVEVAHIMVSAILLAWGVIAAEQSLRSMIGWVTTTCLVLDVAIWALRRPQAANWQTNPFCKILVLIWAASMVFCGKLNEGSIWKFFVILKNFLALRSGLWITLKTAMLFSPLNGSEKCWDINLIHLKKYI